MSDGLLTRDDSRTAVELDEVRDVPVLIVAHHPTPKRIGERCVLIDQDQLELGRATEEFGPGALEHGRISRKHAVVERAGEVVRVRDLGSRNGTLVNDEPVKVHRLQPGDVIGLGPVMLIYAMRSALPHRGKSDVLIGVSAALSYVMDQVERVARTDMTVLIQGETGAGKELVAQEIHRQSGRAGKLVPVNCGALSDGVIQSELFGHARGAFSGAGRERAGLVSTAEGGTLFLDEIGDASPGLQASLLRLLEDSEVRPVGSDRSHPVDVRFVVATHVPLQPAVTAGQFRQDLFGRLERWVVRVPPLRERPEDIVPLALHFARGIAGRELSLSRSLAIELLRYRWPNNVRQLRAVIEQAVVELGDGSTLGITDGIRQRLVKGGEQPGEMVDPEPGMAAAAADEPAVAKPDADGLRRILLAHRCNVRAASQELGVSRNTIYRWLGELGLDLAELRSSIGQD